MEKPSGVFQLVLALLTAAAIGTPAAIRTASNNATTAAGSNAGGEQRQPASAEKLSETSGVSGSQLVAQYAAAGWPVDSLRPLALRIAIAHALIFVVPDPIDSHTDWAFDSEIEAVRRAMERGGYVLDRYWLPWRPVPDGTPASTAAADSARKKVPGVMLFRNGDGADSVAGAPKDRLAVVYLVGEVPTSGVHTSAFAAAIRDRQALLAQFSTLHGGGAPDTLRVVGPTFSGSARSIRNAVSEAQRAGLIGAVSVVSGGATAATNAAVLSDTTTGRSITFHATVNSFTALKQQAEQALWNGMGIARGEIAYLTESGTQYGKSTLTLTPRDTATVGGVATTDAGARNGSRRQRTVPLQIPFPMNISRLRKEYARNVLPGDTAGRAQTSVTRIDWRDPASAAESPAPFSELSAPTIERTLSDVEQTLRLHHTRAVGIAATDARDRLFIASIVKERLPDVTVFFIGSHSLYLRPELNERLRGSLVVSTYPLFLENQYWDNTQQFRDRLVHTSDMAEGTYNATLSQIGLNGAMTEYALPFDRCSRNTTPPVWITTIGTNSLMPVSVVEWRVPGRRSDPYVLPRDSACTDVTPAQGTHYEAGAFLQSLLMAVMLAFALTLAIWWHFTHPRVNALTPSLMAPESDPRWELRLHRDTWMTFRLAAIVCAVAPLTLVLFQPQVHGITASAGQVLVLLAILVVPALLMLAYHLRRTIGVKRTERAERRAGLSRNEGGRHRRWLPHLHMHVPRSLPQFQFYVPRRWRYLGMCALSAAYVGATLVFLLAVVKLDARASSLFFLRALSLDSGVSPVLPLVVGALFLVAWCTSHLTRITMLESMPAFEAGCRNQKVNVSSVLVDGTIGTANSFRRAVDQVRNSIVDLIPTWSAWGALLAVALFAVWTIRAFDKSIESITFQSAFAVDVGMRSLFAGSFDILFRSLILATIALCTWTLYRLVTAFLAFHACLQNIQVMPLAPGFARLPRPIAALTRFTPFSAPGASAANLAVDTAANALWRELNAIARWPFDTARPETIMVLASAPCRLRRSRPLSDVPLSVALAEMHSTLCTAVARGDLAIEVDDDSDSKPQSVSGRSARAWNDVAQDLVALYVVDYVAWVVSHLRHLAFGLLVSLALTGVFLTTYPFQPGSVVRLFFFILIGATALVVAMLLFQTNRDVTLSRMSHTTPGQVTWNTHLVSNLLVVFAIPVLTLLSARFPQIGGFLFSWVAPVLKAVGKG